MNQSISELAQSLRDAATSIERSGRFKLNEEVDLSEAVQLIRLHKGKRATATLQIDIDIPSDMDDEVKVEYRITDDYTKICESSSFRGLIDSYLAAKEGKDSLASVARLVKEASRQEIVAQSAEKTPAALDSAPNAG